jgi:hypothetical protein
MRTTRCASLILRNFVVLIMSDEDNLRVTYCWLLVMQFPRHCTYILPLRYKYSEYSVVRQQPPFLLSSLLVLAMSGNHIFSRNIGTASEIWYAVRPVLCTNKHQSQRTKFCSRGIVHPWFTHRYGSPSDFLCWYCLAYSTALECYMLPTLAPE